MAGKLHKLTALEVAKLSAPGRYSDGGGLYLTIGAGNRRSWIFLYRDRRSGKQREMGLGSAAAVTLAQARVKAAEARAALQAGNDPIAAARADDSEVPTFGEMAEEVISSLESSWRNDKHRAQWRATLETYAPKLKPKRVDEITTEDVLAVLKPIWQTKAETASRVRGRIEKVLDAAKAKNHRVGENPARWRGHLDHLLGRRQKLQRGHHPALPYGDLPKFIAELRQRQGQGLAPVALEFLILTAARTGELLLKKRDDVPLGATWGEIDFEAKVWTIPAQRMKAGVEHRVPLSARAIAILKSVQPLRRADDFIFPGQEAGHPLSEMSCLMVLRRMKYCHVTVHGFRSTFRDWCGEETDFPRDVAEAALAHVVGSSVERAYRRKDALEKRRTLMEAWADYCEPAATATGNVLKMPQRGSRKRAEG
ncbi:MAG: integrase [Hyphomicrobium sp.]|nr:MAG: integrase [Hyphomicrobium sp.]